MLTADWKFHPFLTLYGKLYCMDIICLTRCSSQQLFSPPPPPITATNASAASSTVAAARVIGISFFKFFFSANQISIELLHWLATSRESRRLQSGHLQGIWSPPGNQVVSRKLGHLQGIGPPPGNWVASRKLGRL